MGAKDEAVFTSTEQDTVLSEIKPGTDALRDAL